MRKFTEQEINKLKSDIYDAVKEMPDLYTDFVGICASAWSSFKNAHTRQKVALDLAFFKLISPRVASKWLQERKTSGYINLDMFPEFEETLQKIAKRKRKLDK